MSAPPSYRPCRAWPAWLLGLLLCSSGAPLAAAEPPVATASGLSAALAQGELWQKQVQQLESQRSQLAAAQRQREGQAATASAEIEQLKRQPAGVTPDLALNDRLARAQAQATELGQQAALLRQRDGELQLARRQLLRACDRILDSDSQGQLTQSGRLSWLRLRTAQVEALLEGSSSAAVQALAQRELSSSGQAGLDGDDPQALRDRADLLRDSADKLRHEIDRLAARSSELQRRQRLRERASRVDEDLFAEQSTARRSSSRSSPTAAGLDKAADVAAAPPAAGPAVAPVISPLPTASSSRSGPDPATLDGLLNIGGSGDPAAKLQALARTQSELQGLATELARRATRLEQRAAELGRQK
jgi:hypothetical protein